MVWRERPVERVLLAFHAFANVVQTCRRVYQAGLDVKDYCRSNQPEVMAQLQELNRPLRCNAALTEVGRSLYEPLVSLLWHEKARTN